MKILAVLIVLALLLGVMVAGGPGDEAAKDRAEAERIRQESADASAERRARVQSESAAFDAQAYAVRQQADSLATAVAVNAESQQIAMSAMATQAAITNQYTALTLQPEPGGGFDLAGVLPWAMLGLTLGSAFVSVGLAVVATRRQAPEREIVYVGGSGQGTERVRLLEPQQLLLRPLPPGQGYRARMLQDGRGT